MFVSDVDECELEDPEPICGNNSKCLNTIGSYDCPCCQGYEKDANDTCVRKWVCKKTDQYTFLFLKDNVFLLLLWVLVVWSIYCYHTSDFNHLSLTTRNCDVGKNKL